MIFFNFMIQILNNNNDFDFERFKVEAIKGMYAGKPFSREKGIFDPILKTLSRIAP